MMKNTLGEARKYIFALAVVLGGGGCHDMGADPPMTQTMLVPPDTVPSQPIVSFKNDVLKRVFENPRAGCLGCHGGTNGLFLGTQPDLLLGGMHGPAVVPGNSAQSLIVQKVGPHPPFGSTMPLGGIPMADSLVQILKTWIDQGALDN